ncbi:MAG: AIR synthase family protein [Anaerolineae bacterium]
MTVAAEPLWAACGHSQFLPTGKLPLEVLAGLLARCPVLDGRVVVGARVGEDAAVVDLGDRYLVAKSDPITFATERIGWYAVHVNANDIATRGAVPRWFLSTVLLPEGRATVAMAAAIMEQMGAACQDLGVSLIGGHTEVTGGLERPVVVGHMLGEASRDRLVTTGGACIGDLLVLVGAIAVEGTALIARECAAEARRRGVAEETLAIARQALDEPGISVVRAALIAAEYAGVHALHDPTEGGLATGLHEMAWAAGVGLVVEAGDIPILPPCVEICAAFGLDPLGLIASGSLLAAVAPEGLEPLGRALDGAGLLWRVIGRVLAAEEGILLREGSQMRPLPRFDRDEVARLFSKAAC